MRQLWPVFLASTFVGTLAFAQSASVGNQAVRGPLGAINFGKVNVCPANQVAPKPCNRTSKLKYNVTVTTTFGETSVVTQGTPNLDFTLSATTCAGTLAAGSSCIVSTKFAPRAPGVRMGAVQLMDASGNLLVSTYVYGNGQGPVAAFNPAAQTTLPSTGSDGGAVAVDSAGDLYYSVNGGVIKLDLLTGVQTTVTTGLRNNAFGMAVDGAGNVFVAGGPLTEVAANTGVLSAVGTDLNETSGVAVDGRGNIYVSDDWDDGVGLEQYPRLAEIFSATGQEETLLGGDDFGFQGMPLLNFVWGVAVDAETNAYIATFNFGPVYESFVGTKPPNYFGVIASRNFGSVGEFNNPSSVAVDAAGDVYVADCCLDPTAIYELAPNGTETVAVNGPGETPLAVDAVGNLFYPVGFGNNTLMELNGAQPPTLKFGPVSVGSTSAPQSIAIQNVGNQTLNAVSTGLSVVGNFLQVPGSGSPADCTSSFSLAPGASCNLSIVFAPKVVGTIHGTATFTDNALNTSPSLSQIVTLKGTGQ